MEQEGVSAVSGERVIGIIPLVALAPHWRPKSLVFTDRRLVITEPNEISSLGAAGSAAQAAATLIFGVAGFAAGNLVSTAMEVKGWNKLMRKAEGTVPPVIRLDQPFAGIKGIPVDYANVKRIEFKKGSRLFMSDVWALTVHMEKRSWRNPDRVLLVNSKWAAEVENFLMTTPLAPSSR